MSFNNRTRDSVYRIDNNGNRYPVKVTNSTSRNAEPVKYKKTANNIDKYYVAPPQSSQLQTPKIQTPKLQTPQIQTPKIQTPTLKIQTPQIQTPTPKIQTPQVPRPAAQRGDEGVHAELLVRSEVGKTTSVKSQKRSTPPKANNQEKKMTKDEYRIKNYKSKYNYTKTEQSKQDLISADDKELELRFNGFIQIKEEDYRCIQPNTYIRYLKDGFLYRAGGKLVLNKWPKYWLLESVDGKKIKWSVPLKDTKNAYFQKDPEIAKTKKRQEKAKQRFHEAMMRGDYVALTKEEYEKLLTAAGKLNHKMKKIDYNSEIQSDFNSSESGSESGSDEIYKIRNEKHGRGNREVREVRGGVRGRERYENESDGSNTSGNEENDSYYDKREEYRSDPDNEEDSSVDVRLTKEPLLTKK
jgi:hypothetical protein